MAAEIWNFACCELEGMQRYFIWKNLSIGKFQIWLHIFQKSKFRQKMKGCSFWADWRKVLLKVMIGRRKACLVRDFVSTKVRLLIKNCPQILKQKPKGKLRQNESCFRSQPIWLQTQKENIWAICSCSKTQNLILSFIRSHSWLRKFPSRSPHFKI